MNFHEQTVFTVASFPGRSVFSIVTLGAWCPLNMNCRIQNLNNGTTSVKCNVHRHKFGKLVCVPLNR